METNEPKLMMTAEELFELHPLPWTHHLLLIRDANNRQVIHTGGLYDDRGRLHQGEYLSGLNALLVESANGRNTITSDSARRAAEEIVPDCLSRTCFMEDCGYDHCWGCDDSKVERERVAAIISKHFAAAPADNDAE